MATGKFSTGTGSRTKAGTVPAPLKAKNGNKGGAAKNMKPRQVTARGK